FYVGHLEAFDWNLLVGRLGLHSRTRSLDDLFAFGIDPVDGQLPADQPSDWPPLPEFFGYRRQTRAQLDAALNRDDSRVHETARIDQLLSVAIEHRQMHAETLSYLMHRMPFEQKRAPDACGPPVPHNVMPETVSIPSGATTLGASRFAETFGWDN